MNPSPAMAGTQGNINPTTGEAVSVPLPTTTTPPVATPTPPVTAPAPAAPAPAPAAPAPAPAAPAAPANPIASAFQTATEPMHSSTSKITQNTQFTGKPLSNQQQQQVIQQVNDLGIGPNNLAQQAPVPQAPVGSVGVVAGGRKKDPATGEITHLSPPMEAQRVERVAEMKAAGKTRPVSFSEETDAMYQDLGDAPAKPGLLERTQGVAPAQQTPDERLQSVYGRIDGMPKPPSEPMSVGSANQALMPGVLDTSLEYGYQQAGEPQNRQPQQFVQHGGVDTSVPPNYADMIEAARPTAQLTPINRLKPKTQKDFTEADPIHGYRKYQDMKRRMENMPTLKSFVDMVFNEFGDLFHKADPHEVGSIVMGLYLDKMVR